MKNKKADYSFGVVAWIIIILLGAVLVLVLLPKLGVGEAFYFSACEGDFEGPKIYDPVTNVTLGILNARCSIYDNTGKSTCESAYPQVKVSDFGSVPFCIWLEGRQVLLGKEAAEDYDISQLSWNMPVGTNATKCTNGLTDDGQGCLDVSGNGGYADKCVVNGLVSCDSLTQGREPKCEAVPRCKPVNAIERLIRGLSR